MIPESLPSKFTPLGPRGRGLLRLATNAPPLRTRPSSAHATLGSLAGRQRQILLTCVLVHDGNLHRLCSHSSCLRTYYALRHAASLCCSRGRQRVLHCSIATYRHFRGCEYFAHYGTPLLGAPHSLLLGYRGATEAVKDGVRGVFGKLFGGSSK